MAATSAIGYQSASSTSSGGTQPGHGRIGVDEHPGTVGERAERGGDAGSAVDECEIKIETDHQGCHGSKSTAGC
jgi:hypothetical protein